MNLEQDGEECERAIMDKCCILNGLLAVLVTFAFVSVFQIRATAATERPNVILIMSDDQGWGDVGFNENTRIKTPHLDSMAAGGIVFDRFYASAPICSPTRASVLTGRNAWRTGVLSAHTAGMRVGELTLAEMFQEKEYRTGVFGKWHLGWVKPDELLSRGGYSPPWHHGFDMSFVTTSAVPTWNPQITPAGWNSWGQKEGRPWKGGYPYVENGVEVSRNLEGDDSRIIMDRVIPFIDKNKDRRFFAAVWFHTPHEPVVAGPQYRAMYPDESEEAQHYFGAITAMDEQVGRLRKHLRELQIEKDTLILFCSDNGPSTGVTKRGIASAGPFRGSKHTMYEGGVLVPACAEWPGTIQPGQRTDVRCSVLDYVPTLTQLIRYRFRGWRVRPLDGMDLMPVIQGKVKKREGYLFFGNRRLEEETDDKALISGDWKLIHNAGKEDRLRLYNLGADPYETTDLAAQEPARVQQLLAAMSEIEESCRLSRDGADYRY